MPSLTRSTTSSNCDRGQRRRTGRPAGPGRRGPTVRPLLGRHLGHDLLGRDVEGQSGGLDGVEAAARTASQQGRALDQLVTGQGEQAALGRAGPAVVGTPDALEEGGDAAGRADLADQLDRADVDAELQRGRGHQGAQVAGPQPGLDPVAPILGQAAVVGGHHVVAEALAQLVGQPLGQPPGVDEDQRGAVLADQGRDAVQHVAHLLGRRHRFQLALGQLEGEVEVALMPDVDHRRQGPVADQQPADGLDRALGGRQPDPHRPPVAQRLEPLEGEGQVGAPLVAGDGVDLVDDHRLDRAQRLAARARWSPAGTATREW